MSLEKKSEAKMFGGRIQKYTHASEATKTQMTFSVFLPPQAEGGANGAPQAGKILPPSYGVLKGGKGKQSRSSNLGMRATLQASAPIDEAPKASGEPLGAVTAYLGQLQSGANHAGRAGGGAAGAEAMREEFGRALAETRAQLGAKVDAVSAEVARLHESMALILARLPATPQ